MKFVSFVEWNGTEAVGILSKDESKVIPINAIIPELKITENPMIQLIKFIDNDILKKLREAEENIEHSYSIENVKILSPIRKPVHDIICVGVNNKNVNNKNIKEKQNNTKDMKEALYFSKRAIEIIGDNDSIEARFDLDACLDYEAELAIIIGKNGKDIEMDKAEDYIFGYSIFNNIYSRNTKKYNWQWYKGRSLDSYSSMGPCIVHKDDLKLPLELEIKSILNDEVKKLSNTKNLIHDINYLISDISKGMTLEVGDIIFAGTLFADTMSFNNEKCMKKGDKITGSIEGIGELINFIK